MMVKVTFLKLTVVLGPISFVTSSDLNLPAIILLEQACRLSPYEQMVVLGVGSSRLQGNGLILGRSLQYAPSIWTAFDFQKYCLLSASLYVGRVRLT